LGHGLVIYALINLHLIYFFMLLAVSLIPKTKQLRRHNTRSSNHKRTQVHEENGNEPIDNTHSPKANAQMGHDVAIFSALLSLSATQGAPTTFSKVTHKDQ